MATDSDELQQGEPIDARRDSSTARETTNTLGSLTATLLSSGLLLTVLDLALASYRATAAVTPAALMGAFGGHVTLLVPFGLGLLTIAKLASWVEQRRAIRNRSLLRKLVVGSMFAGVAIVPSWLVATELTSGDWIAQQSFASLLRYGFAGALAVGTGCLAMHVYTARSRFWPHLWLLAAAGATASNHLAVPGLYPAFHVTLYVFAAAMSLLAIQRVLRRLPRWPLPLVVALVGILGALVVGIWRTTPERRAFAFRHSPVLDDMVVWLLPRPKTTFLRQVFDDSPAPKPTPRASLGVPPPNNVLLITVDTLRSDALFRSDVRPPHYREEGDTPFLDEWLASAYRFPNAYASATRTSLSMPSCFLSREPFEDPRQSGVPLATRARRLGLAPLAVVPDWFTLFTAAEASSLIEGFENVEIYTKNRQGDFLKLVKQTLDMAKGRRFFLWLHYFGVHEPYFIGKKKHRPNTTRAQRYRAALRYLDKQLRSFVGELRKRNLLDDTLVVLMSDHGELLGEHGLEKHGMGVHDEESHVPLAIWVPGGGSGDVRALAGNIDVIPTVFDLLGDPHPSQVRGRSLVPDMSSLATESDRALYVLSGRRNHSALITQKHRLVLTHASGAFALYARTDTDEAEDLFGRDPALDRSLVSELVRRNPRLFEHELEDPETRQAVRRRLEQPLDGVPLARLEFLLELVSLIDDPAALEWVKRAYDGSTRLDFQLLVLTRWFSREPEHWVPRIATLLEKYAGRPEETEIVEELARARVRGLDTAFVVERLRAVSETCDSPLATAWLSLIASWETPAPYVAPLTRLLACAALRDPTGERGLLAQVLASVESLATRPVPDLESRILPLLEHPSEWIALSATRALGAVGGVASKAKLEVLVKSKPASRRSEIALLALARIEGPASTPRLLELGKNPKHLVPVLRALTAFGDERATRFLENIAETHKSEPFRKEARKALKAIRDRSTKTGDRLIASEPL